MLHLVQLSNDHGWLNICKGLLTYSSRPMLDWLKSWRQCERGVLELHLRRSKNVDCPWKRCRVCARVRETGSVTYLDFLFHHPLAWKRNIRVFIFIMALVFLRGVQKHNGTLAESCLKTGYIPSNVFACMYSTDLGLAPIA